MALQGKWAEEDIDRSSEVRFEELQPDLASVMEWRNSTHVADPEMAWMMMIWL